MTIAAGHARSVRVIAAGSLLLALLGCEARHSVGTVPCGDDERLLCDPHEREMVQPVLPEQAADSQQPATIAWELQLPACPLAPCSHRSHDYLVHDDGELTLAAVREDRGRSEVWVARHDAAGNRTFEAEVAGWSSWLGPDLLTRLALRPDGEGDALLLVGRAPNRDMAGARGSVRGYAISRSGEITQSFELDTGRTIPERFELLDADVLIAHTSTPRNVELTRYARQGELRWRQTRIASLPTRREIGLAFDDAAAIQLLGLTVDRRGRIWGSLFEGLLGLVQLDPSGVVGWHALVVAGLSDGAPASPTHLATDSRDRPIVGYETAVLRFEPDGADAQRLAPRGSIGAQELYYPPRVRGLDVDAQDRIYVATEDGSRTHRRLLIDRISEDLLRRERFVLPFSDEQSTGYTLDGLQLAGTDAYVRISADPLEAREDGPSEDEQRIVRIVRLQLAP